MKKEKNLKANGLVSSEPEEVKVVKKEETQSQDSSGDFEYISNPYSLGFKAMGELFKYAKGVAFALLAIGLISSFMSFAGNVVGSLAGDTGTSSSIEIDTDETEDLDEVWADVKEELGVDSIEIAEVFGFLLIMAGIFLAIALIGALLSSLFKAIFGGIGAAGTKAAMHQEEISLGEAISQMGSKFGTLFLANFIATMKIIGGYILFFIPGMRAQARYSMLPHVIMNEDVSASQAVSRSKEVAKDHLLELYALGFVGGLIPFVGGIINASGPGFAYNQIDYVKQNDLPKPAVHWANWLNLLIPLALAALVFGIVALVVVLTA